MPLLSRGGRPATEVRRQVASEHPLQLLQAEGAGATHCTGQFEEPLGAACSAPQAESCPLNKDDVVGQLNAVSISSEGALHQLERALGRPALHTSFKASEATCSAPL